MYSLSGASVKMAEADISRAEKKIKLLTERVGCSEDGRLWLEQALDPFTDTPKRPVGFPDLITGKSIVQVVKQSSNFTVGSDGDVHVFMDNVDSRHSMYRNDIFTENGTLRSNMWKATAVGGVGTYIRGGVVVRYATGTGTPLTITTTQNAAGVSVPTSYTNSGRTRVIAKGFEIHNVTPPLTVGGAVTVYRDSTTGGYAPDSSGAACNETTPQNTYSLPVYPLAKVPETLAQVMLIPGAKQWEAKDGCYCVATMNAQTNSPGDETPCFLVDSDSSNTQSQEYVNMYKDTLTPRLSDMELVNGVSQPRRVLRSPFFVSGAFFTGLPTGTKLLINAVYVLERFVDQSNNDLVVLASPSPYLDVVAMELYAKSAHFLRAGVPVSENEEGEWIKDIAGVLGDFGVPGMNLVKGGVDLYNKISAVDSKHDKKKNDHEKDIRDLKEEIRQLKALCNKGQTPVFNVPEYKPKPMLQSKSPVKGAPLERKKLAPKSALSKK